jgi:predicted metal-binding membrane protein
MHHHMGAGAMSDLPVGHHSAAGGVGWSVVMALAMMVPATLPVARAVGFNSLWARRYRAPIVFGAAYVAVWAGFGAIAVAAWSLVDERLAGHEVAAVALLLAAGWQLSTPHLRCLKRCHRTRPLAVRGRAADRSCMRYGAVHGAWCVGLCWPLMLAMVPGHQLLLMLPLTALTSWERLARRPRRRVCAGALAALALLLAALGG